MIVRGERRFLIYKHIRILYNYLREKLKANEIQLEHIPTEEQLVDLLTKTNDPKEFNHLMRKIVFKLVQAALMDQLSLFQVKNDI